MGIRESLLNTITSVGNGDFIRIVTSAGASSKATLANVFKSFESGLGAKSDLGTSDYVRVVGSDNNLYKQSIASLFTHIVGAYTASLAGTTQTIKSALDASVAVPHPANFRLTYNSDIDFNTIKKEWYLAKGSNSPASGSFFYVHTIAYAANADGTVNTGKQIAFSYITTAEEVYIRRCAGGTWTAWQKLPTRAEMDAINSNIKRKIVNYRDITIPASGYVSLDSYASLGVSTSWYLFAMSIRGWSGNEAPRIVKGGSGTEFYAVGTPGTYEYFGVEYYFAVSVETL